MRRFRRLSVVCAVAIIAIGKAAAGAPDPAPTVYTREDLDRMFGPAPQGPSEPVDKSSPADWAWVEQYLDRQYARIDADRAYDLNRHVVAIEARRVDWGVPAYAHTAAFGLGYPASTWWNHVWSNYTTQPYGGFRSPYPHPFAGDTRRGDHGGRGGHGGHFDHGSHNN